MNIPKSKRPWALLSLTVVGLACSVPEASASQSWSYTYNSNGQVLTADGPRTDVSDITTNTYDASGNLATVTNALGHVTQLQDYNGRGQPGKLIDPNGVETLLTYHVRGWLLTSTVKDPGGNTSLDAVTTYGYDAAGQLTSITLPDGSVLNYEYDGAHRLVAVSNSLDERIEYTLDDAGNRTQEVIKDSGGLLQKTLTRTYDELSRLMQVIGANGQTTTYGYDTNNNVTSITDGKSNVTTQGYDVLQRLITDDAPLNHQVDYVYDARDNLTQVQDPKGLTTTYTYDGFDNLTQQGSPDTGVTSYTYDEANNRLTQTDANGVTTSYSYDALNRLTDVSYPNSSLNITYGYDAGTYGKGRLTSVTDGTGTINFDYDARGNLIAQTVALNAGLNYSLSYAYDLANRMVSMTYPDGRTVDYTRDDVGFIVQVDTTQNTVTQTLASNLDYLPFGPLKALTYGNGIQETLTFDQDYRLTHSAHTNVRNADYGYDNNDNITSIGDNLNTLADQILDYDALNRLTNATGIYGNLTYTYDENGNRLTLVDSAGTDTYTYDASSHQLLSTNTWNYQYDNNGNRISKLATDGSGNGLLYLYDDHNRLTDVQDALSLNTLASYAYNALGQRISKVTPSGTTYYAYSPTGQLVAELNGNGDTLANYLYLDGQPLAVVQYTRVQDPAPAPQDIIIDNDSAETSSTGTWQLFNNNYALNSNYRLSNNSTNSYRWTPTGLNASSYDVYVRWVANAQFNPSAEYRIRHSGQFVSSVQDQTVNGGQWVHLGSHGFSGLGGEYIEVRALGGKTVADGVRLIEQTVAPPPYTVENLYYFHNDHLGTPQAMTDNSQNLVWGADYEPFGQVNLSTNSVINNLRFPGQYYDEETDQHYNYFRDYDPATGRYIQSDPIGLQGGMNTYGYVLQNPLRFYDPFGLKCWTDGFGQTVCDSGSPYPSRHCRGGDCVAYPESTNNDKDRECLQKCRTEKVWVDLLCDVVGGQAGAAATALSSPSGVAPMIGLGTDVVVSETCGTLIEMLVCECDEEDTSCSTK